jgi:hypothetical protein
MFAPSFVQEVLIITFLVILTAEYKEVPVVSFVVRRDIQLKSLFGLV